jgi:hypothetical protein
MYKCAYCKYNDGKIYTSMPPKYRCTITNEYHSALDDCDVEFIPVKLGKWIKIKGNVYDCSSCKKRFIFLEKLPNYCDNCGVKMIGETNEESSEN